MEYLKIYISIEDPLTKQDLNISGRFDLLCDFLAGMNKSIAINELPSPMQSFPARVDPSPLALTLPRSRSVYLSRPQQSASRRPSPSLSHNSLK